jgi:hypothetical protein
MRSKTCYSSFVLQDNDDVNDESYDVAVCISLVKCLPGDGLFANGKVYRCTWSLEIVKEMCNRNTGAYDGSG